jgi:hypothetical protein
MFKLNVVVLFLFMYIPYTGYQPGRYEWELTDSRNSLMFWLEYSGISVLYKLNIP